MNIVKPRTKRRIILLCLVLCVVGAITCGVVFLENGNTDTFSSILVLFVGFLGTVIVVLICVCSRIDSSWYFAKTGIVEKRTLRKERLIRYLDIKAISICTAVDRYFFPIYDDQGTPMTVIVIYDDQSIARYYMSSNTTFILPMTPASDALSSNFFSIDKVQQLMDKTKATVFVTQNEYERNRIHLDCLFGMQNCDVFIAVSNYNDAQNHLVTLDSYNRL
jgi:uncharacterized membrane protein YeaQ/YmgE (transglycosylase-associated protein family)